MKLLESSDRFAVATQRSKAVSDSLRTLARVSRFSSANGRARGKSRTNVGARLDALIWIVAFLIPSLVGAVYFGLILAPRYVTDFDFTVRGAEILAIPGQDSRLSGISALDTAQNTMILADYIEGRTILDDVERLIPLRQIYASPAADRFSRLDPGEPAEELQKYLKKYISAKISPQSFAVQIRVRAFTPEDSLKVARAVQSVCESMINHLYERMREKAVREAGDQLRAAEQTLTELLGRMRELRNSEGMLDPEASARQNLAVLLGIEKQRAGVDVRIRSLEGVLSPNAPSMRQLQEERDQLDRAIADQRRAMASDDKSNSILSASMQRFETLKVQRQAAERSYVQMLAAYQLARIQAERQQVFLNTVVPPTLAESPIEPYRVWDIGIVVSSAFAAAIALSGLRRFMST